MDYIGQMQGHLQDAYGPIYYWLTRFPWGTGTNTDREHGQPPPSIYPFVNEDDVLVIGNMR
eukprot:8197453-Pyramimonas_sp.AAC.1